MFGVSTRKYSYSSPLAERRFALVDVPGIDYPSEARPGVPDPLWQHQRAGRPIDASVQVTQITLSFLGYYKLSLLTGKQPSGLCLSAVQDF